MSSISFNDKYRSKLKSPDEAIRAIRSGQRIFIGSSCGEPQHLVNTLLMNKENFYDLEILRLLSLEGSITSIYGDRSHGHTFTVRSIYDGAGSTSELTSDRRFFSPIAIDLIPFLFASGKLKIHVAIIQVSPPDEYGWMSLGISVDITKAAVSAADLVIAQVNPLMPRTMGQGFVHVSEINIIVEHEEELLTVFDLLDDDTCGSIATIIENLVEDGSTIQLGMGYGLAAVTSGLMRKKELGVHSQYLTDEIMALMQSGAVTNRYKTLNPGKTVASTGIGSSELYRFLHNNPAVELHPSNYVNNPSNIISQHQMTAINIATTIDLTGQVAIDALPQFHFSGVSGVTDFIRGAVHSEGGKSILVLCSTTPDKKTSRFVPELPGSSVVVPRTDVHHVVTEFGCVNLFGKSLQERAMALVSIAHPDFREGLLKSGKEMGLIGAGITVKESLQGTYPVHHSEVMTLHGERITFRPVKTMDGRRVQEHFYTMKYSDIVTRFFQQRKIFYSDQLGEMFEIDYKKHFTLIAVEGDDDFGKIIGIGEYITSSEKDLAEVAFSVSEKWQGKGIATIILNKIADAARENSIPGLEAFILSSNNSMIRLFNKLPYDVHTKFEEDMQVLTCRFDRPKEEH